MWLVTAEQMQNLDRRTIQEAKIQGTVLMERAGAGVVDHMLAIWGSVKGRKVVIVCGKGNNGGDGLVIARLLRKAGAIVDTVLLADADQLTPDAKTMYRRLTKVLEPFRLHHPPVSPEILTSLINDATFVVDALLGTGLTSPVREPYAQAITAINSSPAKRIAVDIPSGLDSNTGAILGVAVRADLTVTFGYPKLGLFLGAAIDHTGRIDVVDIGIPPHYVQDLAPSIRLITKEIIKSLIPPRPRTGHKGTFGHVGLLAGSPGKTGAAAMAGISALRIGAGLVTVATPESISPILESKLLEVMTSPIPETPDHRLGHQSEEALLSFSKQKTALGIGPGLGTSDETSALLIKLLPQLECPCLLDADALNAVAGHPEIFSNMKWPAVLTPHPGEMARLLGGTASAKSINENRVGIAKDFAERYRVVLVLKGARTVVTDPTGQTAICPTGNPGMASAGMGDVLTGIITGLLAQGLSPWNAALAGVFLHGLAGDLAAGRVGQPSLIASDVIASISSALTDTLDANHQ
jgi:ADP-dependent NAD(P)H-hydrate dehydratase / NAD(P)H-hydrate epimerase